MSQDAPSPISFKSQTFGTWVNLVTGTVFSTLAVFSLMEEKSWFSLSMMLVGLVNVLAVLVSFYRGRAILKLDQTGLTYIGYRRTRHVEWETVSNFELKGFSKLFPGGAMGSIMVYVHEAGAFPTKLQNHFKIHNDFDKPTKDLLAVLARYRNQAAASPKISTSFYSA